MDAGNIWNVLDNVTEDASTLTSFSSLKDIAVGSGFGLRYDFGFFVFRLDAAIPIYDPRLKKEERFTPIVPNRFGTDDFILNLGIGYPF